MKTNTALSLGLAMFMSLGAILPATAATTVPAKTKPAATAQASQTKPVHYYVSLKAKGAGCEVVEVKPSTKLLVGKHSYKTEADATKALNSAKACKA